MITNSSMLIGLFISPPRQKDEWTFLPEQEMAAFWSNVIIFYVCLPLNMYIPRSKSVALPWWADHRGAHESELPMIRSLLLFCQKAQGWRTKSIMPDTRWHLLLTKFFWQSNFTASVDGLYPSQPPTARDMPEFWICWWVQHQMGKRKPSFNPKYNKLADFENPEHEKRV